MTDTTSNIILKISVDKAAVAAADNALVNQQKEVDKTVSAYKKMAAQAKLLKEVGAGLAVAGAGILAPFILSANTYVARYGQLEATSRSFLAVQQKQADASAAFGRVAASALIPMMERLADITQHIADFASAHPDLVSAAVNVGGALVVAGGLLVAIGQAEKTIDHMGEVAAPLLNNLNKAFNADGIVGGATKAAVGIIAVGAASVATVAAINAYGKATGDEYLATYSLTDTLKSLREVLATAFLAFLESLLAARDSIGKMKDVLNAFVTVFSNKMSGFLDGLGTGINILLTKLGGGIAEFINGIIEAIAQIFNKLGDSVTAQNLRKGKDAGASRGNRADGKTQYEVSADQAAVGLAQRNDGRDKDLQALGNELVQNEKDRQAAYAVGQAELQRIATGVVKFAQTGSLGGLGDSIVAAIKGALGGGGSSGGKTDTKNALPPEAVQAYIDRTKKLAESDKAYSIEKTKTTLDYNIGEKKALMAHLLDLAKTRQEQQRAEYDLARKFSEDRQKAVSDYQRSVSESETRYQDGEKKAVIDFNNAERSEAEKAAFEKIKRTRDTNFNLKKLALEGDVAGYMNEQRGSSQAEKDINDQLAFDKKQRQERFDDEDKDRADQHKIELRDLKKQFDVTQAEAKHNYDIQLRDMREAAEARLREANQQFANEEADRKRAYADQLTALRTKHEQEKTAIDLAFAEQLASLNTNVAGLKDIQARAYADQLTAATNYVTQYSAQLQALYARSLGYAAPPAAAPTPQQTVQDPAGRLQAGFGHGHVGRFASGLKSVPYDDFPAILHRQERVLTAKEAAQYGARQAPTNHFSGSITIGAGNAVTRPEVEQAFHQAFSHFANEFANA